MNTSDYTLILPAEITASNITQMLEAFARDRDSRSAVRIDASGLQHFDSATLALLLALRREVDTAGQAWQIDGASPRLQELARLYGVHDLLFVGTPEGTTMH